jgi:D-glucosaminate-6-phosphate ammonia-lyase
MTNPLDNDPRLKAGLRPVINASGTMTGLGASIIVPEAIVAMTRFMPHFIEMSALQKQACAVIARLCGAEAGFITASASAGLTIACAATMTGSDLAAIERLPDTSALPRNEILIQAGHMVHYGAPVEQALRLSGAKVVPVGTATLADGYQLTGAMTDRTAAAVYVVSHHCVEYGQIPFTEFAALCHVRNIPVIVDAASEYDLTGFIAQGADIALYSAHKFLGGPTAGIVAGRKALVRACYQQNVGIGRGMKVGKEGVVGAIAAMQAWMSRDHAAVRAREDGYAQQWKQRLDGRPGVLARIAPDPTGNPLSRLRIDIDPEATKIAAWDIVDALASGEAPIIARDHEVEHNYFFLDPCNLHPGQEKIVGDRLVQILDEALKRNRIEPSSLAERRKRQLAPLLNWPD